MKKRTLCVIVTLVMAAGLFTGCAGGGAKESSEKTNDVNTEDADEQSQSDATLDSEVSESTTNTDSSGEARKVAFLPGDMANESQAYSAKQFEKFGADYGFEVMILDGQADAQVQAQTVSNCIAQDVDAILINPNDVNGIVPSLMEAKAAGIIVGLFSSDLPEEFAENRDFFVGVNDNMAGETAAKAFMDKFPDGAKIVEVGGQAGHDAQIKRHDGFDAIIKDSNIEVIDSQSCSAWSTSDAMSITEDFITKYGNEIQGVFCHWDNGATGVIEALKAQGMSDVYIVAVDGCRAGFDQVEDGIQGATIMQNFSNMTKKSLEVTKTALDGESYEEVNYIPLDTVTKDNIKDFEYPEW